MHLAHRWVLVTLMLVLFCLGLAACGSYSPSPGNGGTPAPTATKGWY